RGRLRRTGRGRPSSAGRCACEHRPRRGTRPGAQGRRRTVTGNPRLEELEARLSPGALVTDRDVIDSYSSDKALFCPAGTALALVRAADVDDVVAVMRFATEHRIPVVTQGARCIDEVVHRAVHRF